MTFQFVVIPKSLSSYEYKKKARETKKREKKKPPQDGLSRDGLMPRVLSPFKNSFFPFTFP